MYFWTFQVFELQQLTKASKFPFSCRSQALCARHMQTPWFSITSDQSPECNKSFTSSVFIACLASTAPRNGQCAASLAESLCFAGNVPHTFKKCPARLAIVLCLLILRHIALVYTLVVVDKYPGNVKTIGTRHAILAIVAGNRGILHHNLGSVVKKLHLLVGERLPVRFRR